MSIMKEYKKYIISKKEIDLLLEKSKDSPLLRHIRKMAKDGRSRESKEDPFKDRYQYVRRYRERKE